MKPNVIDEIVKIQDNKYGEYIQSEDMDHTIRSSGTKEYLKLGQTESLLPMHVIIVRML